MKARLAALTLAAMTASGAAAAPDPDIAYGAYQRGLYITAFREATARIEKDPGDAPAMTLLGELYNQGLGIGADPVKAGEWYRLAAARGDAHALSTLGLMALDGRGMKRDPAQARTWLEQAAARGEATASFNLALLLLPSGSPADLTRAIELLRRAAELGDRRCAARPRRPLPQGTRGPPGQRGCGAAFRARGEKRRRLR